MWTRKCAIKIALFLSALFYIFLFSTSATASEKAILTFYLNDVEKGDGFVYTTESGDVLVLSEDLTEIGIIVKGKETVIGGQRHTSLKSLKATGIDYALDASVATLKLTAPPSAFEQTVIGLGRLRPKGLESPETSSAFLNYSFDFTRDHYFDPTAFSMPLELGVRYRKYLLYSTYSYTKNNDGETSVRMMTNIVRDDTARMRRYILGDLNATTMELGGGSTIGGLGISKNYSLNPFFLRYPGLTLTGIITSPSDVELWVDGSLVSKQTLHPGEFEFKNIPLTSGVGEASMVIRDSFGKEKRIVVPFYFFSTLLAKGFHEYSYNTGFRRLHLGQESDDYDKNPSFLAFHRYGLTEALTLGYRAEGTNGMASGGLMTNFMLGPLGFFDAAYASSKEEVTDKSGDAYSVGYTYSIGKYGVNLRGTLRSYSRYYTNLSMPVAKDRASEELIASISYANRLMGSVSLGYTNAHHYEQEDFEKYSLKYSRSLFRGLSFDTTLSVTQTSTRRTEEIFANLRYMIGNTTTAALGYENTDGTAKGIATINKAPINDKGAALRLRAERTEEQTTNYDNEAMYYARYGIYSARYNETFDISSYSARAAGSIATAGGSVHLGQPISDSFAIVKTGNIKGLGVTANGATAYPTDWRGETLLTRLTAYEANNISIKDDEVPLGYSLPTYTRYVSLQTRGGTLLDFAPAKLQAITGNVHIVENGRITPAEFWLMTVTAAGVDYGSPLIQNGEFYLENIPVGKHTAQIRRGDKNCSVDISVPESKAVEISVGLILCKNMAEGPGVDEKEKVAIKTEDTGFATAIAPPPSKPTAAGTTHPIGAAAGKPAAKIPVISGTLLILEGTTAKPAANWTVTLENAKDEHSFALDEKGSFAAKDVAGGAYEGTATNTTGNAICDFPLMIPPSTGNSIALPSITCTELYALTSMEGKNYSVQVGAFKERDNAEEVLRRFKDGGFDTFIYEDTLVRVWVGSFEKRGDAARLARNLRKSTDSDAYVMEFAKTSLTPKTTGAASSFTVQAGAFLVPEHAEERLNTLREKGYDAFIYSDRTFSRVLVGKFDNLAEATSLGRSIEAKEGFDTFVTAVTRAQLASRAGKRSYYAVQAGTFKNRSEAEALLKYYRSEGYDAHIYENTTIRVLIGKFNTKKEASEERGLIKKRLAKETSVVEIKPAPGKQP
ncbi:MAG: SPOR domain-containing protein [Deltaproteobacteria bacterium]|nr:SPOR domain-containing protein [Deltaproteobacteria bacterium]